MSHSAVAAATVAPQVTDHIADVGKMVAPTDAEILAQARAEIVGAQTVPMILAQAEAAWAETNLPDPDDAPDDDTAPSCQAWQRFCRALDKLAEAPSASPTELAAKASLLLRYVVEVRGADAIDLPLEVEGAALSIIRDVARLTPDRRAWDEAMAAYESAKAANEDASERARAARQAAEEETPPPAAICVQRAPGLPLSPLRDATDIAQTFKVPLPVSARDALLEQVDNYWEGRRAAFVAHQVPELDDATEAAGEAFDAAQMRLLSTPAPGPAEVAFKLREAHSEREDASDDLANPDNAQRILTSGDWQERVLFDSYCDLLQLGGQPTPRDGAEPWNAVHFIDAFIAVHEHGWSEHSGSPAWPKFGGPSFDMWDPLPAWKREVAQRELKKREMPWLVETIEREVRENFYPGAGDTVEDLITLFGDRHKANDATREAVRWATTDLIEAEGCVDEAKAWVAAFLAAGGTINRGGPSRHGVCLGAPLSQGDDTAAEMVAAMERRPALRLAVKAEAYRHVLYAERDAQWAADQG